MYKLKYMLKLACNIMNFREIPGRSALGNLWPRSVQPRVILAGHRTLSLKQNQVHFPWTHEQAWLGFNTSLGLSCVAPNAVLLSNQAGTFSGPPRPL